ncbi:alkaline phytoceramidase [Marinimicrobium alkaliphilum]|uniref:alkaline phytoceramidase n=1 Tax=Marinimicrobium alkaliphilum TaxID=2202654 RepID=UPI000DBA9B78|nr:alkaline phytoceramidase [Marinimicrobium alkaliphilum]
MNGYSVEMRHLMTALAALFLILVGFLLPAFDQPDGYHLWVDQRTLGVIPNAGDVFSNIGFFLVGCAGLFTLATGRAFIHGRHEARLWGAFFIGLIATAAGSGYYHWHPIDATLVWDRAAMALTFCALFGALVSDRIGARAGVLLFAALLVYALTSIFYWYAGRLEGAGDLRPYAMVQVALFVLIPWILWLYPARYSHSSFYLLALASYALALISEYFDRAIFEATAVISGHSLKHLLGALAAAWLLLMLRRRKP